MLNDYTTDKNFAYIILQKKDLITKISLRQLEKAKMLEGRWYGVLDKRMSKYYVYGHVKKENKKTTIKLHRFIKEVTNPKIQIDHKNLDTLDNSDKNLNVVKDYENKQNSTAKGYYWNNTAKKFVAQIVIDGKAKYLGLFNTEKEAHKKYLTEKKKPHKYWASIKKGA